MATGAVAVQALSICLGSWYKSKNRDEPINFIVRVRFTIFLGLSRCNINVGVYDKLRINLGFLSSYTKVLFRLNHGVYSKYEIGCIRC